MKKAADCKDSVNVWRMKEDFKRVFEVKSEITLRLKKDMGKNLERLFRVM